MFSFFQKPRVTSVKTLKDAVEFLENGKSKIRFINIGSNDGKFWDPMYEFIKKDSWQCVFVEPQEVPFKKLRSNFAHLEDAVFIRAAVAGKPAKKMFYSLNCSQSRWATGLSSFSRQHIVKHSDYIKDEAAKEGIMLSDDPDDWIHEEEIDVIDYEMLLEECPFQHIDILHIDTEGYDFEILKSIPEKLLPTVIHYEHRHLGKNRDTCVAYLQERGYETFLSGEWNTMAVSKKFIAG